MTLKISRTPECDAAFALRALRMCRQLGFVVAAQNVEEVTKLLLLRRPGSVIRTREYAHEKVFMEVT